MTNEEAIEILEERWRYSKTYKYTDAEIREAFDMAIKALEQQPCEDAISRQAVKETIFVQGSAEILEIDFAKLLLLQRAIKALPSVTPQRLKGKWIEVFVETPNDPYSYGFKSHKCSKCEYRPLQILNYCPNCGAKM